MTEQQSSPPDRPDERFTLASERTFLAWMRTSLALMAGGIAMIHLVPEFSTSWVRLTLGTALMVLAVIAAIGGLTRWLQVQRALERGDPMPAAVHLWVIAVVTVIIVLIAAVAAIVSELS